MAATLKSLELHGQNPKFYTLKPEKYIYYNSFFRRIIYLFFFVLLEIGILTFDLQIKKSCFKAVPIFVDFTFIMTLIR